MSQRLKQEIFGFLPNHEPIQRFVISNMNGISADVINYGATLIAVKTPNREGIKNKSQSFVEYFAGKSDIEKVLIWIASSYYF